MKLKKDGYDIEGTPEEIKILLGMTNTKKKTFEPDLQVEAYNENNKTNGKNSGHWTEKDNAFLRANWISPGRGYGKRQRRIHKEDNRVAKKLGRTYEACRTRVNVLKKLL